MFTINLLFQFTISLLKLNKHYTKNLFNGLIFDNINEVKYDATNVNTNTYNAYFFIINKMNE